MVRSPLRFNLSWELVAHFSGASWKRSGRSGDRGHLYYWFQFNEARIAEMGSGSTVMGISLGDLRKCPFSKPPLLEQTAIAAILSDMDAEIAALEEKLTKARQLKQGMMQELLTGRLRLV
jgi:type I restriction enzyme, S subunit